MKRKINIRNRNLVQTPKVNEVNARVTREGKDLSTSEIEYRLSLVNETLANLESMITASVQQLTEKRKAASQARQAVAALEALLEARR